MVNVEVESALVKLDDVPLDRLREPGDDPALLHALHRVVAAAAHAQSNAVAAFNNFL